MTPGAAHLVMTLIISLVAIGGIVVVNSRYHGSFFIGLLLIVLPFLVLSFTLPYLLPVRCPRCRWKMTFRPGRRIGERRELFASVCNHCGNRHEWEGASNGSTLDS
jgi:hypothetical protein